MKEEFTNFLVNEGMEEYPAFLVIFSDDGVKVELNRFEKLTARMVDRAKDEVLVKRHQEKNELIRGHKE